MDEPKEKKYYKIRTKNTFEVKMGLKNLCLLRLKLKILVLIKNYVHRKKVIGGISNLKLVCRI